MMKGNRIFYILLLLLSIIFIYFYGGKVPYALFYLAIAFPLASFLYTLIIYFRFKYIQEIDSNFVVKGDKINFIFNVSNEDIFLYPYISVTFCGSDAVFEKKFTTINFSLPPFSNKSFKFELICKYRGTYEVGISSIEIQDFLGIFKLKYKVPGLKTVTVYPIIVQLDKFYIKIDYMSESFLLQDTTSEDMVTVSEIRKYAYGDSLKRIHWNITAKLNEIMVKKYQSTSVTSTMLIIDLKKNVFSTPLKNILVEDKIIESVIAVLHFCLNNWIPAKVVYYCGQLISLAANNPLIFKDIYNVLARIRFSEEINIEDILDVYMEGNINNTNIIIFSANLSFGLYNQIHKMVSNCNDVTLVYIYPGHGADLNDVDIDNILSFLQETGVNVYKINLDDEIKSVLEGQKHVQA